MTPGLTEILLARLSRREFLKLAGKSLLSLFLLPTFERVREVEGGGLGRIVSNDTGVYTHPSNKDQPFTLLYQDQVFPIESLTRSEDGPDYNPIWYQLKGQGYVHSGSVQPVEVKVNTPVTYLPPQGALFEVSVPFTDTLWSHKTPRFIAYRLYYGTTHWVSSVLRDEHGSVWYKIFDDKFKVSHYANAVHLRQVKLADVEPISPQVPAQLKRLEIRLESQTVLAYEDENVVYMARAATGAHFSNGDFRTPTGHFETSRKRPSRHMASGDPAAPNGYDLPGVPWVCYITSSGIAFHGTYWHNDFGKPRSHGCVNVSSEAARWIYRWTQPIANLQTIYLTAPTGTSIDIME